MIVNFLMEGTSVNGWQEGVYLDGICFIKALFFDMTFSPRAKHQGNSEQIDFPADLDG